MNSNYKKYLIEPEELKTLLNESKEKLSKKKNIRWNIKNTKCLFLKKKIMKES